MPELPDVEGFRRVFTDHARNRFVHGVEVIDAQVLRDVSPAMLRDAVVGHRFGEPRRHGKWLIAPIRGVRAKPAVMMHFGMTGSLEWAPRGEERHRHDRVMFLLPAGELRFRDMRKLKGIHLASHYGAVADVLGVIGPDALTATAAQFRDLLGGLRRQVKPALMAQDVIAGLGNLIVDEILWQAKVNPRASTAEMTRDDLTALHRVMRRVCRQSAEAEQVPPRKSWLTGRRDEPSGSCPRCGTPLRRDRVGGRHTVWCPRCQV